jgi:hypothetical protein
VDIVGVEWEKLIRNFETATGTKIIGFNPRLSGHDKGDMNASFQVWLAERVIKSAKKAKKKS